MPIGYLTNQYPAASHTFIRREIRALEARGVAVRRYAIRRSASALVDPADIEEAGRTHLILGQGVGRILFAAALVVVSRPFAFLSALRLTSRLGGNSSSGRLYHLIYLAEACTLLRLTRSHGVTHIHVHFGTNPAAIAMLCRRLGGPTYSVVIHGSHEFDRPLELSLREKISEAEFVVAISQFCQSQIFRWCPFSDWSKVHIVHCGVDETFIASSPSQVPDTNRLIWIGRISEDKGLPILVQACAVLAAEGVSFEVVVAGDGERRAELEEQVAALGLSAHVRMAGWLSDEGIRSAIDGVRAMVLPSFAEGLPVVLMETMARGRPAVASRIAAIPELMPDESVGWLVTPGSVAELADAMRKALTEPVTEMSRKGAAARARVLERHDVRRSAERLAALFAAIPKGVD